MKKWILLVEDDRDILFAIQDLLETEGYEVRCAQNGLEALELLLKIETTENFPSLILLDLMMPIKDGFQFRQEQLQNPALAPIPVVVMSADGQVEKKLQRIQTTNYIKKPIDLDLLLSTVARFAG